MYLPSEAGERVADLDETFRRLIAVAPLEAKLNAARRSGALKAGNDLLAEAIQAGILTAEEASVVQEAESARQAAIQVDDFPKLP